MITLVTYNIHSGVGVDGLQNYRRIGEFLARRNVDIALLQEMDTRPQHRQTDQDIEDICCDHFQHLIPSPAVFSGHGWYGNAILTRFPVIYNQTIDVSQIGRQPRNIQEVVLQTEQGPLQILNTHKGLKRIERRAQITLLGEHLNKLKARPTMPLIVGGDFNEWQLFSPILHSINELLTPHPVGATFPTRCPLFKLDRLWSRPGPLIDSTQVLRTRETKRFSDHFPIEAKIHPAMIESAV